MTVAAVGDGFPAKLCVQLATGQDLPCPCGWQVPGSMLNAVDIRFQVLIWVPFNLDAHVLTS
jgi:hypothetical protein